MRAVGIDCDGVLANFKQSFIDWFGLKITPNDVSHWDIFAFMPEEEVKKAKEELCKPDFWREMKPYPYAQALVDTFASRGVDVVIVTSPWRSCPQWDEVRRRWINRHVGEFPVITAEDKRYTHVDALIDDKPEHIIDFNEYNRNTSAFGYLVDRPYNREEELTRISLEKHFTKNSWEDLFWEIENRRLRMVSMGIR